MTSRTMAHWLEGRTVGSVGGEGDFRRGRSWQGGQRRLGVGETMGWVSGEAERIGSSIWSVWLRSERGRIWYGDEVVSLEDDRRTAHGLLGSPSDMLDESEGAAAWVRTCKEVQRLLGVAEVDVGWWAWCA